MAGKVQVVAHDPEWAEVFRGIGQKIREALGKAAIRIDHIGSTSVRGMAAKPVIDVQISAAALEPVDAYRIPLERLGYDFRGANPDLTKRYFKGAPDGQWVQIHVRRAGSWAEQGALLFRDYMRTHGEDAARYAALKHRLVEEYACDRLGYTEAKSEFIWETMEKAHRWSQEVGWEPEPPDA